MKWFTYCGNVDTVEREANRWRTKSSHAKRRWRGGKQQSFGLLLHSDDEKEPITDDDVKGLLRDPVVERFFPNGYFVLPADNETDLIITASTGFAVLPDKAMPETPLLRIVDEEVIHAVDLRQRYNNCRSLVKAMGCEHCPDQGIKCFKRDLGPEYAALGTEFGNQPDDDLAKELLKNRVTKIGAFTYISPKLTIPEDHVFVPSYRHYADHDFERIAENSSVIAEANKKAADGRQFKKKQCVKCPIKSACSSYRSCVGPYPPSDEMVKQTLAKWEDKLQQGPFEPWQFWAIARGGGSLGTWSRKEVILQGLHHGRDGWSARIWRSKCDVSYLTSFTDYKKLQEVFTNLPDEARVKEYQPGWGRPDNDLAVALYLMLTETDHSQRHRGGWGGDYYSLLYKDLNNDGVSVRFGGPRYHRNKVKINTFADYRREIGYHLGARQELVRIGGHAND